MAASVELFASQIFNWQLPTTNMCFVLFYWNLEINTLFFASSCHFIAVDWMCKCVFVVDWVLRLCVCVCLLEGKSIYHMHNDHTPGHCSCLHAVGFQFSHLTTHTLFFRGILFFFEKLEHQKSVVKKDLNEGSTFLANHAAYAFRLPPHRFFYSKIAMLLIVALLCHYFVSFYP